MGHSSVVYQYNRCSVHAADKVTTSQIRKVESSLQWKVMQIRELGCVASGLVEKNEEKSLCLLSISAWTCACSNTASMISCSAKVLMLHRPLSFLPTIPYTEYQDNLSWDLPSAIE